MPRTMSVLRATALFVLFTAGVLPNASVAQEPAAEVKDGVFVHISHGGDDPHRLLMGLKMAEVMSEQRDVLVYLDIKAIEVVLKEAEDVAFSHFTSSNAQIEALLRQIDPCPQAD